MSVGGQLDGVFGIILAGSHPWANSPFDLLTSRTLLPIAHRPLLAYSLSWLHRAGILNVAVCGNRETRVLKTRLGRHVPKGMRWTYHEDPMPRGAAGSARDAAFATDYRLFVVVEGATIPTVGLADLRRQHEARNACVTVVVHTETRPRGQPAIHVPCGVYVFSREAFEGVPTTGFCDIKETLIPQLYDLGKPIEAYQAGSAAPRVIDAPTYMSVSEWMVEQTVSDAGVPEGYVRIGTALVHQDAVVAPTAALVGSVIVGPGARILPGATIVGSSSIGREDVVESGSVVLRSAVWRRSMIGARATVDRCLVADGAVLEPGTHTYQGVLTAEDPVKAGLDWPTQQIVNERVANLNLGARLKRLLLRPGLTRSPLPQ